MYPTLSDLLRDLFGVDIPLPIQSFGFMLALSFLAAAWTLQLELRRKEREGLLHTIRTEKIVGKPASFTDLAVSFMTGFAIGYKLFYAAINYSAFVEDTQGFLLSLRGNLVGGLLVGSAMAYLHYREKEKERLPHPKTVVELVHPHQLVSNLTMVAAISGIIGAKLFHNLENLHEFSEDPLGALFSFSGLTMYGGLIVGAAAVMRYGYRRGIHPMILADATAPGLMLAYGTGRMGCHISGDGDWGIVNTAPSPSWLPDWAWAYDYPHNVINEGVAIPGCFGRHCMVLPDPVFPTPLYEAFACVLLFFAIWGVRRRLKPAGMVFSLYLLLNGVERLLIEQIRVNNKFDLFGLAVTQAEVIAVSLIGLGVSGLYFFHNHPIRHESPGARKIV